MTNPWLRHAVDAAPAVDPDAVVHDQPSPLAAPRLRAIAQQGVALPPPAERFPRRTSADPSVTLWWVGAHGGAGESTLEQLLEGSRAAGHAWPVTPAGSSDPAPRVAIVARTNWSGLRAAQQLAIEWSCAKLPVELLGLVLIADAPGRLPRQLKDRVELVSGAVPRLWQLPWVEHWRLCEAVTPRDAPRAIRNFTDDVSRYLPAAHRIP